MNRLHELRNGLNQGAIVAGVSYEGLDRPLYSKLENGVVNPTQEMAEAIAQYYGVTVDYVWPELSFVSVYGQVPKNFSCACAHGSNAKNYSVVIPHIPIGKQNAVSWKILSARTGLRERHIRQLIEDARNDGEIILNFSDGYYYPDEPEDAARYFRLVHKTAKSYLRRLKPLRKMLEGYIAGQIELCLRCGEPAKNDLCDECYNAISKIRKEI